MIEPNIISAAQRNLTVTSGGATLTARGLAAIKFRSGKDLNAADQYARYRTARAVLDRMFSLTECSGQTEFPNEITTSAYSAFLIIKELAESGFERAYFPMYAFMDAGWRIKPASDATAHELRIDRVRRIDEIVPWPYPNMIEPWEVQSKTRAQLHDLVYAETENLVAVMDWCAEHFPLALPLTKNKPKFVRVAGVQGDCDRYLNLARSWLDSGNLSVNDSGVWCDLAWIDTSGFGRAGADWAHIELFLGAAERGSLRAQCRLGLAYGGSFGKAQRNDDESMRWYRSAANQSFVAAQYWLAMVYRYHDDLKLLEPYQAEAVKLWLAAASHGHAAAQYELGVAYRFGVGVAKDEIEAMRWFRASAELDAGQYGDNLGWDYELLFFDGEVDLVEAIRWYRAAAELGSKPALEALVRLKAI